MTKEIIVNAGELESRVAILENGRLMELHVEREPKIVGNIYKGRVTKVLKGMDAAFVDIGIERNAFLAASDVVASIEDDSGGRGNRGSVPPITSLLHNNQEILCQVVRAPLGTKGARITTRLSLPGRYMVLMLNSGAHVGVSRKIEDVSERHRLRALANEVRPENYSLIVRTEAEGKSEEELRQDITFLLDMAKRIEKKAATTATPALIHGDLTLIFRLIRDAFTRDVNRLVVDSPSTYENVLELVGMIAPRMKNRVFLYDEALPIFHTYNIEPEIERTLRRKVWLPSGGSLIIDQAEALTAIDVNTGRFVGSVELAETVLTTNLQACDEVARQLRLRDLGGIIVIDFIDMDNPRHRQQVMKAFEEALKRDRAKLKVHSISSLGLVEMTRKRTGDSLVRLLTEPCPYCSGIGRVQNSLTMALSIERELAATAVEHPETEAYQLTAHSRVIASMLGYEGEAQRDLEQYLEHPVYLRADDNYHPNAYRLERLTLEQALAAVQHIEEDEIVEAQVVNPDPEVSLSPLGLTHGIYLIIPDLDAPVGARVKVKIKETGTSLGFAEPLAAEQRGIRGAEPLLALTRPPLVPESALPRYLREERLPFPPREMPLLSPTSDAVPEPVEEELEEELASSAAAPLDASRRRKRSRRRKNESTFATTEESEGQLQDEEEFDDGTGVPPVMPEPESDLTVAPSITEPETAQPGEPATPDPASASSRRRRRRRRRGSGSGQTSENAALGGESLLEGEPEEEPGEEETTEPISAEAPVEGEMPETAAEPAPARRRNRRRRCGGGLTPENAVPGGESLLEGEPEEKPGEVQTLTPRNTEESADSETPAVTAEQAPPPARRRNRRRRGGSGGSAEKSAAASAQTEAQLEEPIFTPISQASAAETMLGLLNAIPAAEDEISEETLSETAIAEELTPLEEPAPLPEALAPTAEVTAAPIPEPEAPAESEPVRAPRRRRAARKVPTATDEEAQPPVAPLIEAPVAPAAEQPLADVTPADTPEDAQPAPEEKPTRRRRAPAGTARRRAPKAETAPAEAETTQEIPPPEGADGDKLLE